MSRGTSRGLMLTPDEEIQELTKHLTILEQERKTLFEESKSTSNKNKEAITTLQIEKSHLRSKLKTSIKAPESESSRVKVEDSEEILKLRRRLDQLRNLHEAKRQQLKSIRDKLSEIPTEQATSEEVPMNRQIRVLENRLDKAMIKYNEAQSIRKTYEQIVKQLKQERVAYDNQLAAIERSLKGKDHDFEELLLLSHDANHAKETAEAELCRFEAQVLVERLTRSKNVEDKKDEVQKRIDVKKADPSDRSPNREDSDFLMKVAGMAHSASNEERLQEEKQKIKDYESAFRRIKEATGVTDVNEIIQKFGTQEDTFQNLETLKLEHQKKLEKLSQTKLELKKQVDGLRFNSRKEQETKKVLKEAEDLLARTIKKFEKAKTKKAKIEKTLQNTLNGVGHIHQILSGFRVEGQARIEKIDENLVEVLIQCQEKMKKIYFWVRENQFFHSVQANAPLLSKPTDTAQRTAVVLQAIYAVPEMANSYAQGFKSDYRGRRNRTDDDDDFSEETSSALNDSVLKDKLAKENSLKVEKLSKGLRVRRASSAAGRKKPIK
jgi:hypothetical protein